MITAVDTNILLDVFLPDPKFGECSAVALEEAEAAGSLVICEPVYAELAVRFPTKIKLDDALAELQIAVEPVSLDASWLAGKALAAYRNAGGKRERIITDFLIGAHAQKRCTRLLTRDRGFYRSYFKTLVVFEPITGA